MAMNVLVCECGSRAEYLTADHGAERPMWVPGCGLCPSVADGGGYTLSVADLEAKPLAWWMLHIGGKRWGARSDFNRLVAGLVGYSPDPRVRAVARVGEWL